MQLFYIWHYLCTENSVIYINFDDLVCMQTIVRGVLIWDAQCHHGYVESCHLQALFHLKVNRGSHIAQIKRTKSCHLIQITDQMRSVIGKRPGQRTMKQNHKTDLIIPSRWHRSRKNNHFCFSVAHVIASLISKEQFFFCSAETLRGIMNRGKFTSNMHIHVYLNLFGIFICFSLLIYHFL